MGNGTCHETGILRSGLVDRASQGYIREGINQHTIHDNGSAASLELLLHMRLHIVAFNGAFSDLIRKCLSIKTV